MIIGLQEPFYLQAHKGTGVITDAKRRKIGSISPAPNDLWRDDLTGRAWNSPIAAAHTYLLARAPEQPNPETASRFVYEPIDCYKRARRRLCRVLLMPLLPDGAKDEIRRSIRTLDKHFLTMEKEK
jgi:hypothetical protein